jgi:hypothetical protein
MKKIVSAAVAVIVMSSCNMIKTNDYLTPPKNENELEKRLVELRREYDPYLQSLPVPLKQRSRQVLDSDKWLSKFEVEQADINNVEIPMPKPWYFENYDDSKWEQTIVPEWRYQTAGLQTSVSCILWYRNTFDAKIPKLGERVFLNFEGVDWEVEVWLNGNFLGNHLSYYEPFRFDVTTLLKKNNTLAVRIKSGQIYGMPRANWGVFPTPPAKKQRVYKDESLSYVGYEKNDLMTGAGYGIFRSVYLETTGIASVSDILVRGYPKQGKCIVKSDIDITETASLSLNIQIIPENFKGKTYVMNVPIKMQKGITQKTINVQMPGAKLWSPTTPYLYRCRILILDGDRVLDWKDVIFGHRSFEMVSELNPKQGELAGRLLLNDEPIYLRGTNVQGFNLLAHWNKKDKLLDLLFKLKAANFNAVRSCQHVQFREVRELMDRLGIMSQQDQGGRYPYERMEDMKSMTEENWKIVENRLLSQILKTSAILAKECYNNPGVIIISNSNEAGKDRGPWEINPTGLVKAALAIDSERIIKPICGHHAGAVAYPVKGRTGYDISDELWRNVIDDVHTYQGWYTWQDRPDLWALVYPEDDRLVTVGEYGAEALDSYETMLNNYPKQWGPTPARFENKIWGNIQTQAADIKQIIGFRGKIPENLEEYIQASQTVQADILTEVTKGLRISSRISGYFQFHFVDVLAAYWPKSIISHDNTPKKGYFAMAQVNQALVPLPLITQRGKIMELWVVNDYNRKHDHAYLTWNISYKGKVILQDALAVSIKAGRSEKVGQTDLSKIPLDDGVVTISMELFDSRGDKLSTFEQEVYLLAFRPEFQEGKR